MLHISPAGAQEPAAYPGAQAGSVHPVGAGQYPGGAVQEIPVHPLSTSRIGPHAGKPHVHLSCEFVDEAFQKMYFEGLVQNYCNLLYKMR